MRKEGLRELQGSEAVRECGECRIRRNGPAGDMTEGMEMNILILSAGTRNKVVQAFHRALNGNGRVVATDASPLAPALYDADKAYVVPRITAPDYLDRILELCRREEIRGVFSLIDPELSLLARERARFEAIGVTPVVSSYELCETCLDKYRMYGLLQKEGIRTARCWTTREDFQRARKAGEVSYPVFVKPQCGSASLNINRAENDETVKTLFDNDEDLMVQELMVGQEYGCDAYVDLVSGKCTSLFLKKKIRMRAGETDKSVSVKDPELFRKLALFAEKCGFRGMIDIDLFHDEHGRENETSEISEGEWFLSEVNPRFGGGYPHAYACGVDFPSQMIANLKGKENPVTIGDYETGIVMMKYNEIAIRREGELA